MQTVGFPFLLPVVCGVVLILVVGFSVLVYSLVKSNARQRN